MSNVRKIYVFSFFWMFLVIIPVIVPFFMNIGLSMGQVFQLQALFGIGVVLLEVPTGYLCDLWGRKNSLVLGTFISGVGFTLLIFAKDFWTLAVYELVVALALSFVSGADVSLLYDSIKSDDRMVSSKSLANMQMASVTGESVASVLGGLLVVTSFHSVLLANAVAGWMPFLIALSLKEVPYTKMSRESHWKNFKEVLGHVFSRKDEMLFMISINLVVWSLSSFIAVWMLQKYWEENNVPLSYFGFIWAALNISVGIVGKQVHWIEHKIGPLPLIVALGVLPVVGYFGMGLSYGILGVAFGFCIYFGRGITQVLLRDALNWRTPARFRATANSMQSFFFRLGFALLGPGVGYLIDKQGLRFTFHTLGFSFLFLFFVTLLPLMKVIKKIAPKYIPES